MADVGAFSKKVSNNIDATTVYSLITPVIALLLKTGQPVLNDKF